MVFQSAEVRRLLNPDYRLRTLEDVTDFLAKNLTAASSAEFTTLNKTTDSSDFLESQNDTFEDLFETLLQVPTSRMDDNFFDEKTYNPEVGYHDSIVDLIPEDLHPELDIIWPVSSDQRSQTNAPSDPPIPSTAQNTQKMHVPSSSHSNPETPATSTFNFVDPLAENLSPLMNRVLSEHSYMQPKPSLQSNASAHPAIPQFRTSSRPRIQELRNSESAFGSPQLTARDNSTFNGQDSFIYSSAQPRHYSNAMPQRQASENQVRSHSRQDTRRLQPNSASHQILQAAREPYHSSPALLDQNTNAQEHGGYSDQHNINERQLQQGFRGMAPYTNKRSVQSSQYGGQTIYETQEYYPLQTDFTLGLPDSSMITQPVTSSMGQYQRPHAHPHVHQGMLDIPGFENMKEENEMSDSSPEPPKNRPKRVQAIARLGNDPSLPRSEAQQQACVARLVNAMNNMNHAEDNEGMKTTWRGMMRNQKIIEKACWQVLDTSVRAHQQDGPLVEGSKPAHQFDSFEARIKALCTSFKRQKTMCKHLMTPPYIETLVDDPITASNRIKNNRKVNHGKKKAIDQGRIALGQKAQGKGRRPVTVGATPGPESAGDEELDADFDDYEVDPSNQFMQRMSDSPTPGVVAIPSRKAKGSRKSKALSEDSDDSSYAPARTAKKIRKQSKYQLDENNIMRDVTEQELPAEHEQHEVQRLMDSHGRDENMMLSNTMLGGPSVGSDAEFESSLYGAKMPQAYRKDSKRRRR